MNQVVNARRGASGLSAPGRLTAEERKILNGGKRAHLKRVDVYGRQVYVTTEGTTRRGLAHHRMSAWSEDVVGEFGREGYPRLLPESVYEIAGDDRVLALRLLRRFGYLLD